MLAGSHQGQLDLILDILNMNGAAGRHPSLEGGGDLFGQLGHGLVDTAGGGRRSPLDCEEGFGDGH